MKWLSIKINLRHILCIVYFECNVFDKNSEKLTSNQFSIN